jgi:hypothetical protein
MSLQSVGAVEESSLLVAVTRELLVKTQTELKDLACAVAMAL